MLPQHNLRVQEVKITGYFINSQRFLYKITDDKQLIDNAVLSSEWLIKIYEKLILNNSKKKIYFAKKIKELKNKDV